MVNEAIQNFTFCSSFILEIFDVFLPETQPGKCMIGLIEGYKKHKNGAYTFFIKIDNFTLMYHCIDPDKIFQLIRAKGFYICIVNNHSEQKGDKSGK